MPSSLVIKFPSVTELDRARAFTVHKNYVSSISTHLLDQYGPPDLLSKNLLCEQRSLSGFSNIQGARAANADVIRRYLTISWASEIQLRLSGGMEAPTLRYSNAWAPVHAYYAAYMSLQAWFAANGMAALVDDHSSSLRTIANHIAGRDLFPSPFSVTCSGCPQLGGSSFSRAPIGANLSATVQVLANPRSETFWPLFGTMLKTTRERRLERNFKEWKKTRGRKAMSAKEKMGIEKNLPPTTIFDFLWRLRIRSNYHDVSSFLTWNVSDLDQQKFSESVILLTGALCTLTDSLVVRKSGKDLYRGHLEEFLRLSPAGTDVRRSMDFLDERLDTILS